MCRASRSPSVPSVTSRTLLRPPLVDVAIAAAFVAFAVAEGLAGPGDQPWWRAVAGGSRPRCSRGGGRHRSWSPRWWCWPTSSPTRRRSSPPCCRWCWSASPSATRPARRARTSAWRSCSSPFIGVSIVDGFEPSDLAAALVFFAGPWTVGTRHPRPRHPGRGGGRPRRPARGRTRAARPPASPQQERTRIARELHDIVSHSISVVTIQTQAVRRRLGPDHAREAEDLAAVEATAREALAEMRRLFGVLRTDGESASLAPQPGLSELGRLVEQVEHRRDAARRLRVEGEPVELSPGLDLAAYRIAQEGLTNALRHSGARARHGDAALELRPARRRGRGRRPRPRGRAPRTAVTAWSASANVSPCTAARVRLEPAAVRRHPAGRHPAPEGPNGE